MLTLGFVLWYGAPAGKLVAAAVLAYRGMVRRYWPLVAFLLASAGATCWKLALRGDNAAYARAGVVSSPILALLECAAAIGVFYVLTEQYPRFGRPGAMLLSTMTVLGFAAAAGSAWVLPTPPAPSWFRLHVVALDQYGALVVTAIVGASAIASLFSFRIPVRASSRRAAMVLCGHAAIGAGIAAFTRATMITGPGRPRLAYPIVSGLVPILNGFLVGPVLMLVMTRKSDQVEMFVPRPEAELEAAAAESSMQAYRAVRLLKAQLRQAIHDSD